MQKPKEGDRIIIGCTCGELLMMIVDDVRTIDNQVCVTARYKCDSCDRSGLVTLAAEVISEEEVQESVRAIRRHINN